MGTRLVRPVPVAKRALAAPDMLCHAAQLLLAEDPRMARGAVALLHEVLLEIDLLLPDDSRQHRTLNIQQDVLPYALFPLLCPVSVALASIFWMDSISTSEVLSSCHSPSKSRQPREGGDRGGAPCSYTRYSSEPHSPHPTPQTSNSHTHRSRTRCCQVWRTA